MNRRAGIACLLAAALLATAPSARAAGAPSVVVQFDAGVTAAQQRAAVHAAGGVVFRDLHVIHALGVRASRRAQHRLARTRGVRAVTPDAAMRPTAAGESGRWAPWDPGALATAFVQSTRTDKAWTDPRWHATGAGVGVAVLDTGVAGGLPDFSDPQSGASRVVESAVTNPGATTATDLYGHGTHVAGLIAGNGRALPASDPLYGRYTGTAPDAKLVSVKVSDDDGNASVIDVIAGLQFVVDHAADYGVRVVNLSLGSSVAQPYGTDPLDAAVEAAWLHGIVVVVAAGNRGSAPDAVSYAPANDPYAITVGAVDDHGTKDTADDTVAPWSSRGVTEDGFTKPDVLAPGAHIVAPLSPGSDYASLCAACVVDGRYFRVGGTSMAAPIVAGIAADLLSAHPGWTPDQVKGALIANLRPTRDGGGEVAADVALYAAKPQLVANQGLTPNSFIDPATGSIDYTRASWARASWAAAAGGLRASWAAASWTCECSTMTSPNADPTRASWARASWARASWASFFSDSPDGG